jgi:hypothetical protein
LGRPVRLLSDTLEALLVKGASATPADRNVAILMTLGGIQFNFPGRIQNLTASGSRDDFSQLKGSIVCRGAPTAPATPASIWVTTMTGSALVAFYQDLGFGQFGVSGTPLYAVTESVSLGFAKGQLNKADFAFVGQGAPTLVTS